MNAIEQLRHIPRYKHLQAHTPVVELYVSLHVPLVAGNGQGRSLLVDLQMFEPVPVQYAPVKSGLMSCPAGV